jgi:NTE family protein
MATNAPDSQNLSRQPILVDFALQGGGAHGAFTWGVLDRLLEEPSLRIDGISGTSAGAMNAAVLAAGYAEGGAPQARRALERYWCYVSRAARFSPFRRTPLDVLLGRWTLDNSPLFVAMDVMSRLFSPYDFNVGSINPLRGILEELIDFGRIKQGPIKLFISATNVRTGRVRVFRNAEITPDVLLASACLPTLFLGGRGRWRELLGRWLCRQSDHDATGSRMPVERHHSGPDQSDRAPGHSGDGA